MVRQKCIWEVQLKFQLKQKQSHPPRSKVHLLHLVKCPWYRGVIPLYQYLKYHNSSDADQGEHWLASWPAPTLQSSSSWHSTYLVPVWKDWIYLWYLCWEDISYCMGIAVKVRWPHVKFFCESQEHVKVCCHTTPVGSLRIIWCYCFLPSSLMPWDHFAQLLFLSANSYDSY